MLAPGYDSGTETSQKLANWWLKRLYSASDVSALRKQDVLMCPVQRHLEFQQEAAQRHPAAGGYARVQTLAPGKRLKPGKRTAKQRRRKHQVSEQRKTQIPSNLQTSKA